MLLTIACFLALAHSVPAGNELLMEEEKDRFSNHLLLPSPAEVFVAMDKLGKTDWNKAASYNQKYDYSDDYLRALNLGIRAADGFLAIQARDKSKLGEMIKVIITLAEELLVQETILDKGKTFEELSRRDEWEKLHRELDKLRDDVVEEMKRLGDRDIALLVSAGGWLEGLRAASGLLKEKYDAKGSSVLYQPRLVDYFLEEMGKMDPEARTSPAVAKLIEELPRIKDLVDVGYRNPLPEENVKKLNAISDELIKAFERG